MRQNASSPTLALVALLLAGACGEAGSAPALLEARPAPAPAESTGSAGPLVLFLGDSLAAGLDLPAEEAFPAVLQRLLAEEGRPFRLINAGVSGDTTAGGLRRLHWLLRQRPDWVVVELGGNDGLRGLPLESIEENLRAIVARARAGGARVLLLGLCLPANYGRDYGQRFEALYARVAEELELDFVPCFLEGVGGVAELNFSDGIHPTAEGHVKLAEKLAPVLGELLAP